jgi:hypothetical protein
MILCVGDAPEEWMMLRILSSSLTSISIFSACCFSIVSISEGVRPEHFPADLDPACHIDADPDPAFHATQFKFCF